MRKQLNSISQSSVVKDYLNNIPTKIIKETYKIGRTYIRNILLKNNIPRSRRLVDRQRKYTINETFFEKINHELKAYFLGLLLSDGHVNHKQVSLSLIDLELIQKLKECLAPQVPIRILKPNNTNHNIQYQLNICSIKLVQTLQIHGMINNKAKRIEIPNTITDQNLIKHFIRGYLDGDGCIFIKPKGCGVQITSCSKKILQQIELYFKKNNILNENRQYVKNKTGNPNNCFVFRTDNRYEVINILDHIYLSSSFCLKRKYEKYLQIKKNIPSFKRSIHSSQYKGVSFNKKQQKYLVQFRYESKSYYLGTFDKEVEAAITYNKKIKDLGLSYERLNTIPINDAIQTPDSLN